MKILAIDTSSDVLSICVNDDNNFLGEYTIKNNLTHSPKIIPMIDELLKGLNLSIKDINLVSCSIGPGSFTGLRIGLATIKGIAQANNIDIIGIPTLLSLAKNVKSNDCLICPIIDAKNENIYTCIFDSKYNLIQDYTAITIDELISLCKKLKKSIYFIGNGAIIHKDRICENIKQKYIYKIQDEILSAKNIAECAYEKYINNQVDSIYSLSPMYLKSSSAERLKK